MITIIAITAIFNITWLFNIRSDLKNIKFEEYAGQGYLLEFSLRLKDGTNIELQRKENKLIKKDSNKIILDKVDTHTYNKEFNTITGLLADSSWFKIYVEGNKVLVNISGEIRNVEDTDFFIFGMGQREKYIYANSKLLKYSNNEIVLDNLILDKTEYENYTIYAKDLEQNEYRIYENEKGIYIEKNDEIQVLDESTKINIPDFSHNKNEKALKILFNEVMVNITKDGPKPNFIAYENAWYRDAAIVAMVLKETRKYRSN